VGCLFEQPPPFEQYLTHYLNNTLVLPQVSRVHKVTQFLLITQPFITLLDFPMHHMYRITWLPHVSHITCIASLDFPMYHISHVLHHLTSPCITYHKYCITWLPHVSHLTCIASLDFPMYHISHVLHHLTSPCITYHMYRITWLPQVSHVHKVTQFLLITVILHPRSATLRRRAVWLSCVGLSKCLPSASTLSPSVWRTTCSPLPSSSSGRRPRRRCSCR